MSVFSNNPYLRDSSFNRISFSEALRNEMEKVEKEKGTEIGKDHPLHKVVANLYLERYRIQLAMASKVMAACTSLGWDVKLTGSNYFGDAGPNSDIDLMVRLPTRWVPPSLRVRPTQTTHLVPSTDDELEAFISVMNEIGLTASDPDHAYTDKSVFRVLSAYYHSPATLRYFRSSMTRMPRHPRINTQKIMDVQLIKPEHWDAKVRAHELLLQLARMARIGAVPADMPSVEALANGNFSTMHWDYAMKLAEEEEGTEHEARFKMLEAERGALRDPDGPL